MGSWLSVFGVWKSYDKTADPATGLSEYDRHLITTSWDIFAHQDVVKENAVEFFLQLYEAYPYTKEFFPIFKDLSTPELRKSPKMKAHALTAMYSIGILVKNLDDTETLVGLAEKIAVNHVKRKIKSEAFKDLAIMFTPYLRSVLKAQCTPDVEAAWGRLLAALASIVKQAEK